MGVEASYYNVQYISSKEEGFPETFFRTKISQHTVYYILLYPSWIDKFIATKKRPDKTDLFIVSQMSSYQATSS